jgi:hypothetical protein
VLLWRHKALHLQASGMVVVGAGMLLQSDMAAITYDKIASPTGLEVM